ncbi:aldose 1-epimerase [Qipengyuania sp. DGS5-3]|uniref:aldose 1-epimerase n=1 Tax=Qipengyuania sp. DGS5-3 TaxID=3349632 RepID=UPI0036D41B2F
MLNLQNQDVELAVNPRLGGGISAFRWRGLDVFRPQSDSRSGAASPLDLACFPMVPFCNRIADANIAFSGQKRALPTAPDGIEHVHALHGVGWISPWAAPEASDTHAILTLRQDGTLWPWAFEAEQRLSLTDNGYSHTLAVTNRDSSAMPTGLGLHPYFPRAKAALELGAEGYWKTGEDRLPEEYCALREAPEWFSGDGFDDCFKAASSSVSIAWPTHRLTIRSSPKLRFAHVYIPPEEDFFCVEPVSHIPDAVNRELDHAASGLVMLEPGETFQIECRFELEEPA